MRFYLGLFVLAFFFLSIATASAVSIDSLKKSFKDYIAKAPALSLSAAVITSESLTKAFRSYVKSLPENNDNSTPCFTS